MVTRFYSAGKHYQMLRSFVMSRNEVMAKDLHYYLATLYVGERPRRKTRNQAGAGPAAI